MLLMLPGKKRRNPGENDTRGLFRYVGFESAYVYPPKSRFKALNVELRRVDPPDETHASRTGQSYDKNQVRF